MNGIEEKLSKLKSANYDTEKECSNLKKENNLLKRQVCTNIKAAKKSNKIIFVLMLSTNISKLNLCVPNAPSVYDYVVIVL